MTDLRRWAQHKPNCATNQPRYIVYVSNPLMKCDCGLREALMESETWNPDLTTAPRDQRIKLQLPPYVTGHLTTVVSVEPIAWAPIETESQT